MGAESPHGLTATITIPAQILTILFLFLSDINVVTVKMM
jgi:hypothetical protein